MKSNPKTVKEYLDALPADQRATLQTVREVILKNLDKDFEEGIQYGGIGYYVPHRVFPQGYHCDPKQPLNFAGMAARKNYLTLTLMCIYGNAAQRKAFEAAWKTTGKKLDMGAACIKFKKLDDLPLDVIGSAVKSVKVNDYVSHYLSLLSRNKTATKRARKAASPKRAARKKAKSAK